MLGSDVPPCRTITFDGGQFTGRLAVPVLAVLAAEGELVGAAFCGLAGVAAQSAEETFFLWGGRLAVVLLPWALDVCAGVLVGAWVCEGTCEFCTGGVVS
jgi:hypothetical protein